MAIKIGTATCWLEKVSDQSWAWVIKAKQLTLVNLVSADRGRHLCWLGFLPWVYTFLESEKVVRYRFWHGIWYQGKIRQTCTCDGKDSVISSMNKAERFRNSVRMILSLNWNMKPGQDYIEAWSISSRLLLAERELPRTSGVLPPPNMRLLSESCELCIFSVSKRQAPTCDHQCGISSNNEVSNCLTTVKANYLEVKVSQKCGKEGGVCGGRGGNSKTIIIYYVVLEYSA